MSMCMSVCEREFYFTTSLNNLNTDTATQKKKDLDTDMRVAIADIQKHPAPELLIWCPLLRTQNTNFKSQCHISFYGKIAVHRTFEN